jgi:Protein of unknown function (DUF3326)
MQHRPLGQSAIRTTSIRLARDELESPTELHEAVAARADAPVLRWHVARADASDLDVELSTTALLAGAAPPARPRSTGSTRTVAVSIVPTGIGCAFGGFAGDAGPVTSLLATTVDYLVTNPNAVTASDFAALPPNVVYTEGSLVDLFCEGAIDLRLPVAHRVGLVLEEAEEWKLDHAVNVANAVRAVHGVDVLDPVVTEGPVGTRCVRLSSGAYAGAVDRPEMLLAACEQALERGATAIAMATEVGCLPDLGYADHYFRGGPNPVGGAEALLSHLVCRRLGIPAGHAPMINFCDFAQADGVVDPRGAAEFVSTSGLAGVLLGLARAPQLDASAPAREVLSPAQVLALVAPASALGGAAVLHALRRGIPVLAVRENETILRVTAERLGLDGVVEVATYLEAAGALAALRAGIALASLRRPLASVGHVPAQTRAPRVLEGAGVGSS